jgi:hypothetical protein
MAPEDLLTLGQVASHFGVQLWQMRQAIARGLLKPSGRVGGWQVIHRRRLEEVRAALERGGYLKPAAAEV